MPEVVTDHIRIIIDHPRGRLLSVQAYRTRVTNVPGLEDQAPPMPEKVHPDTSPDACG